MYFGQENYLDAEKENSIDVDILPFRDLPKGLTLYSSSFFVLFLLFLDWRQQQFPVLEALKRKAHEIILGRPVLLSETLKRAKNQVRLFS